MWGDNLTMKQLEMPLNPIIETVQIQPTKEMPFDVFERFHHFSYFAELMERTPDGKVIWDESVTSIVSDQAAKAEYLGLQNDWFSMSLEVPKEWIE